MTTVQDRSYFHHRYLAITDDTCREAPSYRPTKWHSEYLDISRTVTLWITDKAYCKQAALRFSLKVESQPFIYGRSLHCKVLLQQNLKGRDTILPKMSVFRDSQPSYLALELLLILEI
jgi:hypothetical protein